MTRAGKGTRPATGSKKGEAAADQQEGGEEDEGKVDIFIQSLIGLARSTTSQPNMDVGRGTIDAGKGTR